MKYGEIEWKVEKIVYQVNGGVVTRKSEVDEGRSFITKVSDRLVPGLKSDASINYSQ